MYLRVAQYDMPRDMPNDAADTWDRIIGSYLAGIGTCQRATLAMNGSTVAVVTEWDSANAYEAAMNDHAYAEAAKRVAEEFGISDTMGPASVFTGEIAKQRA